MEDPDLAHQETAHSRRVKAGIARARARGQKWGRPTVAEKMDSDLTVKVFEMRAQGLPWSEVASQLDISESTARRLLRKFQGDCESRDRHNVKNTVPERNVTDTCQKDYSDDEMDPRNFDKSINASDSERPETIEAITYDQGEFVKAALQLVLESEHLTKQVLQRIRARQDVQKHP